MERRFIIDGTVPFNYLNFNHHSIEQAYLENGNVRVRRTSGPKYFMTSFEDSDESLRRVEQKISMETYNLLYNARQSSTVRKTRYTFRLPECPVMCMCELDVYDAPHEGLRILKVQFFSEADMNKLLEKVPSWVGEDITNNLEYRNSHLAGCK